MKHINIHDLEKVGREEHTTSADVQSQFFKKILIPLLRGLYHSHPVKQNNLKEFKNS